MTVALFNDSNTGGGNSFIYDPSQSGLL